MTEALPDKHRPNKWEDVVGNEAEVRTLEARVRAGQHHAFLLVGPSGIGKTTLARIAAFELGCEQTGRMEIDAATNSGIDEMRKVQDMARYMAFGSPVRVVIVDECQGLSKSAWDSLLKMLEEPPEHLYWFLCTTDLRKVPATVQTRAMPFTLKALSDRELKTIINRVARDERIRLADKVEDVIIFEARGSARAALVYLDKVADARDAREAGELLNKVFDSDPVRAFCQFLVKPGKRSWAGAMKLLEALEDQDPEGVRIIICNYTAKALKSARDEKTACELLSVLDAFDRPFNRAEQAAPLYLAIGRVIYPAGGS